MIDGILVGQHQRTDGRWLTGTTVVLCPAGAVGGVESRGGAPGTRETDLLDPRNLVDRVHAVVLTGGSAFGLAAATGVMEWLEEQGVGWPVGALRVPIVPAAVLFDLGRGGDPAARPDAGFGRAACRAATAGPVAMGNHGAGTGARAGGFKGGVGHATVRTPAGHTVEAVVAVNAAGSVVDRDGRLHSDVDRRLSTPDPAELAGRPPTDSPLLNTTIGVVCTDAALTKAQCQRLAGSAHDGLAISVRPAHTMSDGDTFFALSTQDRSAPSVRELNELIAAAGTVVTAAVCRGLLAARTAGGMPGYLDVFSSVDR